MAKIPVVIFSLLSLFCFDLTMYMLRQQTTLDLRALLQPAFNCIAFGGLAVTIHFYSKTPPPIKANRRVR